MSFHGYHASVSRSASWWMRWAINIYSFLGWTEGIKVQYSDEEGVDLSSYFGAAQDRSWRSGLSPFVRWVANARGRCRIDDSAEAPGAIFSSSSSSSGGGGDDDGGGGGGGDDTVLLALPALCDSSLQHLAPWISFEEGGARESARERDLGEVQAAVEPWMSNGETIQYMDVCPSWHVLVDMESDGGGDVVRVRGPLASVGGATGGASTSEGEGVTESGGEAAPLLDPWRGRGGPPAGAGWARREGEGEGEGEEEEEDKVTARLYEYGAVHMKIAPAEFKATAISRIRDLGQLLRALEAQGAVRTCTEGAGGAAGPSTEGTGGAAGGLAMSSIFGFSRLFVCDVNVFNAGVRSMVQQVWDPKPLGSWVGDYHELARGLSRTSLGTLTN